MKTTKLLIFSTIFMVIAAYTLSSHKLEPTKAILEMQKSGENFELSSKGLKGAKFTIKDGNLVTTFDVGGLLQLYTAKTSTLEIQIFIDGKPALLNLQPRGSVFLIYEKDTKVTIKLQKK
ncbi:MAG: hypothetical protein H7A23_09610 [Leptospiraceae bacterium]|nr:hypothetical protein [Leptospiraceae bacterium]MCP5494800.1 hypothetical protein [Leptospiraceae bacterium]